MYFVYIQNTNYVFVFKYIFSHSILYLYLNKQFQTVFCIFIFNTFWFICAHLCPWHSWAQEYFQKPLLVNTIRCAIWRCQLNLYHAKRKPYVNMVQKCCHVLWVKAHSKFTFSKWKTSPNVTFLLEITDAVSSRLKRRETFQHVISV